MTLPEFLMPLSITVGICTNIATDIIKHHLYSVEDTFVGHALKMNGLLPPNFMDNIHSSLKEGLELYFEKHPEYCLTGIEAFFRDPIITNQISNYILDRKSLNPKTIEDALVSHLKEDNLTRVLLKQRGLNLEKIVPDFLEAYRWVLNEHLDIPQMALLLSLIDQTASIIQEMKLNEIQVKDFIKQRSDENIQLLKNVVEDQQAIIDFLGIKRGTETISETVQIIPPVEGTGIFGKNSLCDNYYFQQMPNRYFIAQEFTQNRDNLRRALTHALKEFELRPLQADDYIRQGLIICKIIAIIESTPFGIYQLAVSQNRNVYLELGIAIGLGKPFILVKEYGALVTPLIEGLEYYSVDSYLELRYELGGLVKSFLTDIRRYTFFKQTPVEQRNTLVVAHGDLSPIDFCATLGRIASVNNLKLLLINKPSERMERILQKENISYETVEALGGTNLDRVVEAIRGSQIVISRIDIDSSPDAFLVFGIAMALNRYCIPIHEAGRKIPSNLKGIGVLEFQSYSDLEHSLGERLKPNF